MNLLDTGIEKGLIRFDEEKTSSLALSKQKNLTEK